MLFPHRPFGHAVPRALPGLRADGHLSSQGEAEAAGPGQAGAADGGGGGHYEGGGGDGRQRAASAVHAQSVIMLKMNKELDIYLPTNYFTYIMCKSLLNH